MNFEKQSKQKKAEHFPKTSIIVIMDLSLDLSLSFFPNTVSLFLGDVSRSNRDSCEKLAKLEDFLKRLEDEMKKIEAFKRELPICMLLVNDAVTRLKEERVRIQDPSSPVTEEFMPTERASNNGVPSKKKESCDKMSWMSSAQLWSTEKKSRCEEEDWSVPENPVQTRENDKSRSGGGALFNGNSFPLKAVTTKEVSQVPSFTLMTPAASDLLNHDKNSKTGCGDSSLIMGRVEMLGQPQQAQIQPQHLQQNPRKQRRCWSPELHRRFVDALQQLGGPQVATPKQIRELMQVEGLTNDEVKSHLQKYRLHVRRFPVSSDEKTNDNGLWVTKDQYTKENSSQSGSPQGPLLLRGSVRGSVDAEDEQSDCRNWKDGIHQHQPETENQSL